MKNIIIKIILILGIAYIVTGCTSRPKERVIEGKVQKDVISFSPKVTGRILDIYVKEGEIVEIGDTLAKIDVPEVRAKIAQAEGAALSAKAQSQMAINGATQNQLEQLRAKQKGVKEQYNYAKKSYERAENMYRDSLISPQNYDEIFAKYQGAKAQLEAVNAALSDTELGTRYEKINMADGQLNRAMGALQEANIAYSERYIVATNNMEVETITLHKGELATAGYALFSGYIPETTYFRFTIPESKIAKYKKGMNVKMTVIYNKEEFIGEIRTIKQLSKYADITTAFPEYNPEDAVYEVKVIPDISQIKKANEILVNANIILK